MTPMGCGRRVLAALLLITFAAPALARAGERRVEPPAASPDACADTLGCRLAREIALAERFLLRRKYGLPITLDPRPLTNQLEVLRLNVMSQAMGYLNLYRSTRGPRYGKEARDRLNYLLDLGDAALGNGTRDGMYGYAMLDAYELLGDARYLEAGRRAAHICQGISSLADLSMNSGLMCALNNAYLARLDGGSAGGALADEVVDRTAPRQFEDGAFPHIANLANGRNLNYSSWMANELLMLRDLRPENELTELLLVKTVGFLQRRVTADGSLGYRDEGGTYDNDPGNPDPRFLTSELASVALNLAVAGHRDEAARCLAYLFRWRMRGENLGGYPDKYANVDSTNVWEIGSPSVLRTSLIFWYLTLIQRFDRSCAGLAGPCAAVGPDCPHLYAELGLCDRALPGVRSCIAGRLTRCFDPAITAMRAGQVCAWDSSCVTTDRGACYYACPYVGSRLCVGDVCRERCQDVAFAPDGCIENCVPRRPCPDSAGADPVRAGEPVSIARSAPRPAAAPFEAEFSSAADSSFREDLSIQIVRFVRDVGSPGSPASVVLRANHHGSIRAPHATIALSRPGGEVLAVRDLSLEPARSLEVLLRVAHTDSIVARLEAHDWLREADTLDNVARADGPGEPSDEAEGPDRPAPGPERGAPLVSVRGPARLVVSLDRGDEVELGLYDIAGRLVRTLWRGPLAAGAHAFDWDLRTEAGMRAKPGVYFARLRTGHQQTAKRLVIVR